MTVSSVSAVIVNWNGGDDLVRCVRSLADHRAAVPVDITVVDNASTDGSVAAAVDAVPGIRVLQNERNVGLAPANNQGIAASTGDAILICNPDTELRPGAIDALVALLEARPRAAFAIPRLQHPDGTTQTSVGSLPGVLDALAGRRLSHRSAGAGGFWWDGWAHDAETPVGHGAEAAYLVRRAAVDAVGMQDERFLLDWEGIDWAARAADHGWEVWFTPAAEVVHRGGTSIRQAPFRWIYRTHRGMARYLRKRRPVVGTAVVPLIAVRALVKAAMAATGADLYGKAQRGGRR